VHARDIILREKAMSTTDVLSIICFVCSSTKEQILTRLTTEIDQVKLQEIERFLDQRRNGKPLAYITKKREFYSEDFIVDANVLVPRPETEVLVEEALTILGERRELSRIVDMGTGSGAIGLTIARRARKEVVCVDVSLAALTVARQNARALGVDKQAVFVCSDLFAGIRQTEKFDMILSNLPYVASEEWDLLAKDVKDYEPKTALAGGPGGIEVYKRFSLEAPAHLARHGYMLCEIGGGEQASAVKGMFESAGLKVVVKNDYAGTERVLIGSWINLS